MKFHFYYCQITVTFDYHHVFLNISDNFGPNLISRDITGRRDPELSFDIKLDGITGLIVADIDTLKSVRIYLIALVFPNTLQMPEIK